ncbi:MAG TPA: class I SAM-dependent methyltransferase [Bacteroidales bacterium]|nr:class I SAM-dependent methyltransferase [Bacteroidales bacterium]HCI55700.1 SAM-dependent methyltransferase [Bacteroidales bacterium]HOU96802.1 class I SAM-dependent methyltransferase [Bacteroidales bacterium]HQG37401.1 class I SAM-dependent methyltransferase [Bacteroidales bacterium]HQG52017.1 class I SAM-dependent methyltransferase [Bacteroidales bacterium]
MAKTKPFDKFLNEYEQWFIENYFVYLSELEVVRKLIPYEGKGVEVGVGSGLFASPLGIKYGCDPSETMRKKASERGISAIHGIAEDLPYENNRFDFVLMVTTICFVDDPDRAFREISRILKPDGELIIGFIDKNSPVGKQYSKHKKESVFYRDAIFYSTQEIHDLLGKNGFFIENTLQTVFGKLNEIKEIQHPEQGSGEGCFVVIKAKK